VGAENWEGAGVAVGVCGVSLDVGGLKVFVGGGRIGAWMGGVIGVYRCSHGLEDS
jgi:hypothetical protein